MGRPIPSQVKTFNSAQNGNRAEKSACWKAVRIYRSPHAAANHAPLADSRLMNNRQLVEDLCAISPSLRESRRVHISSFGTLIPHVFMGDVLTRVGACLPAQRRAACADDRELAAILGALERGMALGDRETRNVIAISFASDGELEPFMGRLRPHLGPRLRAQLPEK
jgi:hypothetical protein